MKITSPISSLAKSWFLRRLERGMKMKKSVANCNDCAGAGRQKCNSGIAQCSAKNPFQYLGSNSRHKVSDCQLFTGWGMCLKLSRLLWKKKILSLHFLPSYERKNNRVLMIVFCVTFPPIGRQGEYFARGTHTRKMDINVSMSTIYWQQSDDAMRGPTGLSDFQINPIG